MFTKGEDNLLVDKLNIAASGELEPVFAKMNQLSKAGYRIQMLTMRNLKKSEWDNFEKEYNLAKNSSNELTEMLRLQESLEVELELLGVAVFKEVVEEPLKETVKFIKAGKIKIWMASSDKGDSCLQVAKETGLMPSSYSLFSFSSV